jgi:ATP-dependent exoDNAse (exonuclease V) beta subunit
MCEETIPMGELEGIRILSIHKSKGLEFHTVIFPLADWTFTKQGFSTTLWCQPTGEFEGLDLLPVDYGNEANEFFNKENNEERLKTYVDNLNLVYVANTRARNNLIVISGRNELSENQKKKGGLSEDVAYLMWKTMEKMKESGMHSIDVPLEMSLAEDDDEEKEMSIRQYEKGELLPSKEKVDEEEENVLAQKPVDLPITFHQNKMLAGFRQSNQSAEFVKGQYDENDDGNSLSSGYSNDYINQGLLFHYLLSLVHTLDDVDKAFLRVSQEGYFESQEQENSIRKLLRQALQNEQVRGWFAPDWNVVNECAIIDKNDEGIIYEKRPDRVISKQGETIVIDYKTGDSQTVYSKYKEQVKEYIDLLKRAGYENVKGYLWYVMDNKVVPVSDSNNEK